MKCPVTTRTVTAQTAASDRLRSAAGIAVKRARRPPPGVVKILDLGLARLQETGQLFKAHTSPGLTQAGVIVGTIDFMAPELAEEFAHVVVLDPPTSSAAAVRLRTGTGYTHLAWGEAELRFAQQMHELEYGLRASLVDLYRGIRARRRVAGEELEQLLRAHGRHGRPARVAGRLVRVLAELQLVSLDRQVPALMAASEAPTGAK